MESEIHLFLLQIYVRFQSNLMQLVMFWLGSAQKPQLRPGFGGLRLVKMKAQAIAKGLGRPGLSISLGHGLHPENLNYVI